MKKLILVTLIFTMAALSMFALTSPKALTQEVVFGTGDITTVITNTSASTAPGYVVTAQNITPAHQSQVLTTATDVAAKIRLFRSGNGTTVPYFCAVFVQFSNFNVQWYVGDVVHLTVTKTNVVPNVQVAWDWTIPDNAATNTFRSPNTVTIPPLAPVITNPNPATIGAPADNAQLTTTTATRTVTLTWVAPAAGPAPDGYKMVYDGGAPVNVGNVLTQDVVAGIGDHTWQIIPFTNGKGGKSVDMTPIRASVRANGAKGDAVDCPTWHFSVAWAPTVIPPNDPTVIADGIGVVTPPAAPVIDFAVVTIADVPPVAGHVLTPANTTVFTVTATSPTTFNIDVPFEAGVIWCAIAYYGGSWHYGTPPTITNGPGTFVFDLPFGAKNVIDIIVTKDMPLPVELSSFTAVLDASYFVNLTWVTQTETQVAGFDILRSDDSNASNAVKVNSDMVAATNTSQTHSYTLIDNEVQQNHTYYYWLQYTDMGGNVTLHGPQSVTINAATPPVLPEISKMNSAYPNPFSMGATTNIEVSVKAGEVGTVTIYNILGQAVKTWKVNPGISKITWDGKGCSSGIYFTKFSTPSTNATKKLVIVR